MNHSTKLFTVSILLLTLTVTLNAQTNVSGGIYSNITWTKANSPYIVVDTIVVFPNATFTIEPGVIVKFANNKLIEIRQATLLAIGTLNDSITFTSSSGSPYPGIYDGIKLDGLGVAPTTAQFKYCNFMYAKAGFGCTNGENSITCIQSHFINNISGISPLYDWRADTINNCHFEYNTYGMLGYATERTYILNSVFNNNINGVSQIELARIQLCTFTNNSGIAIETLQGDSIVNNSITDNDTGIYLHTGGSIVDAMYVEQNVMENNNLGILIDAQNYYVTCNRICNNIIYNLKYSRAVNVNLPNNYWCTTDSSQIEIGIYDGYDNISLGLVYFEPIDTLQCYLTTGIPTYESKQMQFSIFPNPVSDVLMVFRRENSSQGEIKVFNMLGELTYSSIVTSQKINIDISTLASGIYIVQVGTDNNIARQKFIKEKNIR